MNKLHSGCGINLGVLGINRDIAIENRALLAVIAVAVYGIPSVIALQMMIYAIGLVPTTALIILMTAAVGYGIYRIIKTIRNAQPSHS